MNTFIIPEGIESAQRNAEVLEKVLNIIPILGIVLTIIFIMLNLLKHESIKKFNKVYLIINSICLVFSILNIIYNIVPIAYIPGTVEYYYYEKFIYVIPIILSISWIILFYFYKKNSND